RRKATIDGGNRSSTAEIDRRRSILAVLPGSGRSAYRSGNVTREVDERRVSRKGDPEDSHSSGDASGDEGLADAEDRVPGCLDALPRELRLLGKVHDSRNRRIPGALPHHILRRHQTLQRDRIGQTLAKTKEREHASSRRETRGDGSGGGSLLHSPASSPSAVSGGSRGSRALGLWGLYSTTREWGRNRKMKALILLAMGKEHVLSSSEYPYGYPQRKTIDRPVVPGGPTLSSITMRVDKARNDKRVREVIAGTPADPYLRMAKSRPANRLMDLKLRNYPQESG
ncbi:hypothetical protein BHE74_00042048, partial [Ensete ventricosum]